MSRIAATRVIAAPAELVWQVFTDLASGRSWLSPVESVAAAADVVMTAVDAGRSCTLRLADASSSPRLTYLFTPIAIGSGRGGTAVQLVLESEYAVGRRSHRLADHVLAFMVGGFAARTAEGALRAELETLAHACALANARRATGCCAA